MIARKLKEDGMKLFGKTFDWDEILHDLGVIGLGLLGYLGINADQATQVANQAVQVGTQAVAMGTQAVSGFHAIGWAGIGLALVKLIFHNVMDGNISLTPTVTTTVDANGTTTHVVTVPPPPAA